eukprot:TRINITY_DN18544_c0_g1_i2.p1 TRINITY_DN18544_c0_g1~~TRINITY_DN18544_c0_g1_i2.p1  ORF type:complete len:390 (-),score=46.49 TRINITY_DN18544_c0_g1_i2:111-1280(-)
MDHGAELTRRMQKLETQLADHVQQYRAFRGQVYKILTKLELGFDSSLGGGAKADGSDQKLQIGSSSKFGEHAQHSDTVSLRSEISLWSESSDFPPSTKPVRKTRHALEKLKVSLDSKFDRCEKAIFDSPLCGSQEMTGAITPSMLEEATSVSESGAGSTSTGCSEAFPCSTKVATRSIGAVADATAMAMAAKLPPPSQPLPPSIAAAARAIWAEPVTCSTWTGCSGAAICSTGASADGTATAVTVKLPSPSTSLPLQPPSIAAATSLDCSSATGAFSAPVPPAYASGRADAVRTGASVSASVVASGDSGKTSCSSCRVSEAGSCVAVRQHLREGCDSSQQASLSASARISQHQLTPRFTPSCSSAAAYPMSLQPLHPVLKTDLSSLTSR